MANLTKTAEDLISDLADTLDVPPSRYESAERSYKSVSDWLDRPGSRFASTTFNVYIQGSFRLGTAIRPFDGREDYDLDIVCEFSKNKLLTTQKKLFDDLGYELGLYSDAHSMETPAGWDRCWTLNYADEAQFHMDLLPCVPDGQRQRRLRVEASLSQAFVEKSVSITDKQHPNYVRLTDDWPVSNPNGYAEWFYERMKTTFEAKRRAMMLMEKRASVAEIPAFRVKTPLQAAIQILKHHRNVRFSEDADGRPTSIVISTLAAAAYQQEANITGALLSILTRMEDYIKVRNGQYWIPNPSDPRENFADAWKDEPKRKDAFYDWLETVRADFNTAAEQNDIEGFIEALSPRIGRDILEKAARRRHRALLEKSLVRKSAGALQRILDAPHRKPIIWPKVPYGAVNIVSALVERDGFRPTPFESNGPAVPKNVKLKFVAETDVLRPFKVYWQVVNTGVEARNANQLRGRFEETAIEEGRLVRREPTRFKGTHSIQCFIVKDGYCVGWSDPFLVNIA